MIDIKEEFKKRYNKQPDKIYFSPGRVNLIGEHIDYNGGRVMPCAISLGTYLAVAKNTDKIFRFHSTNFPEQVELHLQTSYSRSGKAWYNYPLGVIDDFLQKGQALSGLDLLFSGNLPVGAGLSSSASIEVLMAFALNELFKTGLHKLDIALLAKKVENEFIGVNCGIMDQFAVTFGEKNKAIVLDCDTLEYELLPFDTGKYMLVIINTNKPRSLSDSKYNERFSECGAALRALKKELNLKNLCDLDIETFHGHKHLIADPVLEKRATHVIAENYRVNEAVKALMGNNLTSFGQLMYGSHDSLKNLYEVSGVELDTIVNFCKTFEGCIGARMTGAGFGGCAIALIQKESFEKFSTELPAYYHERIGYDPQVFSSSIGDGVKVLS